MLLRRWEVEFKTDKFKGADESHMYFTRKGAEEAARMYNMLLDYIWPESGGSYKVRRR